MKRVKQPGRSRACNRFAAMSRGLMLVPAAFACFLHGQSPAEIDSARKAMEAGQYAAAEQAYRKALAGSPSSAVLLTDLGLSLQMQGKSEDAMHFYTLALKQGYVPETYALLAEEKCRMGELDILKPMLARIFKEELRNSRVLSAVAPCYLDIDEPVESAIVYQQLLESNGYPEDLGLVQLAKSYIRSGQFFAARLSKIPAGEPFLAALRQASDAGDSGARSAFPQAAKLSQYFSPGLSWSETVERWRQHPHDAALLYLASVLSAEEGMRQIEICAQRFPGSPYLEQFQADVLADQGHEDEAAEAYEELLRQHPDLSDLRYSLGLLREKQQQWQAASQAFRAQLDAYPSDERALAHLSRCLLAMEQYAAVRDLLEPRMREERPPQWASLNLAEAEQKLGDPSAAISILTAAEKRPDADKLVHYRLSHLYAIAGKQADAKREFALFQAASKQ